MKDSSVLSLSLNVEVQIDPQRPEDSNPAHRRSIASGNLIARLDLGVKIRVTSEFLFIQCEAQVIHHNNGMVSLAARRIRNVTVLARLVSGVRNR